MAWGIVRGRCIPLNGNDADVQMTPSAVTVQPYYGSSDIGTQLSSLHRRQMYHSFVQLLQPRVLHDEAQTSSIERDWEQKLDTVTLKGESAPEQ
jgi:hypothetical protein